MSFYENRILPFMIDLACSTEPLMELRERVVPKAFGEVLEIGMGSAVNVALYDKSRVTKVWGLEPSIGMRRKAQKNLAHSPVEVELIDLPGEAIPLADKSIDSIVLTYTLCTIPDWEKALEQMHRVLKDDGTLLFCEHGLAPDTKVQKWQNRLTPMWKKCAGGCHLNRPIADYLARGGFEVETVDSFYLDKSPRFVGYMYVGQAHKKP